MVLNINGGNTNRKEMFCCDKDIVYTRHGEHAREISKKGLEVL